MLISVVAGSQGSYTPSFKYTGFDGKLYENRVAQTI
jgi:hypothetical protein